MLSDSLLKLFFFLFLVTTDLEVAALVHRVFFLFFCFFPVKRHGFHLLLLFKYKVDLLPLFTLVATC